ncbi:peptide chain release factor N(5)-glutamine methyltransferase [Sedimentibacter sp. MB31-C6]|uniref:peptide chain release factor N(5)-glutamine methyltransferase n=1 Tax=Sedimentibacter sp. MB31-C6 TaxID=3109366 RepID=UPI002DDDBCE5|nr:peptide chain release factor N(5)-glutamine methyltransferase [Sedimentibacter sp. MB36-C1]WSI03414.1 peptide chain release factor N(5)-glutamine methyltransferase [Sedimentibacter sp. MB36-C1]
MVTIEKLLKDGVNIIKKRDYNNPFLDVQLILSYLLKKDRIYLHLNKDEEVDAEVSNLFYRMVEKRDRGYPLQYMIKSQEFMGLKLYIQEGVLIPRPDTEILVEKIIKFVNNSNLKNKQLKVLDIGTGSGAIAVSLAHFLAKADVTAIDVSDIALQTAEINKNNHNLKNMRVIKGDIFEKLEVYDKFDIVVSNPPYIENNIIDKLPLEVSNYEPRLALDGGLDGLDFYRQIVRVFKEIHSKNSILAVEIGYNQKEKVMEIFNNINLFDKIESDKDLNGNDRVVTGFL